MQFAPKKVDFITLKKGEEIAIGELVEKLVYMGYKRVEFVSEVGEFAIRGDILDIFPINTGVSFRVDFFYDEVEKIVEFDFENAEKEETQKPKKIYSKKPTTKAPGWVEEHLKQTKQEEVSKEESISDLEDFFNK